MRNNMESSRGSWKRYVATYEVPMKAVFAWLDGYNKGYRAGKAYLRRKAAARHFALYYRIERHGA